jgi:hypothetical protein
MQPATQFTIENWKPFQKNTMQGFVDLVLPSGLILRSCTLHEKGNKRWIGMPAKSYTDDAGSTKWVTMVDFTTKEGHARFQEAALEAVERYLGVEA